MSENTNPFERWDLDPSASTEDLTRSLRTRARQLPDDEVQQLREDWRRLVSDAAFRARWVLLTPPPLSNDRPDDPWNALDELIDPQAPQLTPPTPTLSDALILPTLRAVDLDLTPPFLPPHLRRHPPHPDLGEDT